jgi:hypothetical protein
MTDDQTVLVESHLECSFKMYDDLVASLSCEDLAQRLPVPSNTIGGQLWCVIGARESWARAIEEGGWQGFSCSVSDSADLLKPEVMARALQRSAAAVRDACGAAPQGEARTDLKLQLLVHESQHQGQILRYLLGLKMEIPVSWKEHFGL